MASPGWGALGAFLETFAEQSMKREELERKLALEKVAEKRTQIEEEFKKEQTRRENERRAPVQIKNPITGQMESVSPETAAELRKLQFEQYYKEKAAQAAGTPFESLEIKPNVPDVIPKQESLISPGILVTPSLDKEGGVSSNVPAPIRSVVSPPEAQTEFPKYTNYINLLKKVPNKTYLTEDERKKALELYKEDQNDWARAQAESKKAKDAKDQKTLEIQIKNYIPGEWSKINNDPLLEGKSYEEKLDILNKRVMDKFGMPGDLTVVAKPEKIDKVEQDAIAEIEKETGQKIPKDKLLWDAATRVAVNDKIREIITKNQTAKTYGVLLAQIKPDIVQGNIDKVIKLMKAKIPVEQELAQARTIGRITGELTKEPKSGVPYATLLAMARTEGTPPPASVAESLGLYSTTLSTVKTMQSLMSDQDLDQIATLFARYGEGLKQFLNQKENVNNPQYQKFMEFLTLNEHLRATAFQYGGKQLTPFEASVVFGFTPTGREIFKGLYRIKMNALARRTELMMNNAAGFSKLTRGGMDNFIKNYKAEPYYTNEEVRMMRGEIPLAYIDSNGNQQYVWAKKEDGSVVVGADGKPIPVILPKEFVGKVIPKLDKDYFEQNWRNSMQKTYREMTASPVSGVPVPSNFGVAGGSTAPQQVKDVINPPPTTSLAPASSREGTVTTLPDGTLIGALGGEWWIGERGPDKKFRFKRDLQGNKIKYTPSNPESK